jgi:hypothetical protein
MSATLEIKSDNIDKVLADVDRLGRAITSDDVKADYGARGPERDRHHFVEIANDSAHHKTARSLGAAPTGVYEEAARGTSQPEVSSEGVTISIHQVAIAQRFFGGRSSQSPRSSWPSPRAPRRTANGRASSTICDSFCLRAAPARWFPRKRRKERDGRASQAAHSNSVSSFSGW